MTATREEVAAAAINYDAKIMDIGVPQEVFELADVTRTVMSLRLREIASDPMWADHVECRKDTLIKAAREAEEMAAAGQFFREQRNRAIEQLLEADAYIKQLTASLLSMQAGGTQ